MSFEGISFGKLAIIFIVAGVVLVLAIMGSSATSLFSQSITEDAKVKIKHQGNCVVEASDNIPRTIANCPYNVNDTVVITYKPQRPSIENYESK
jgi:flagellar basal body-associated protein FliL